MTRQLLTVDILDEARREMHENSVKLFAHLLFTEFIHFSGKS
jgi:hypothetical protein